MVVCLWTCTKEIFCVELVKVLVHVSTFGCLPQEMLCLSTVVCSARVVTVVFKFKSWMRCPFTLAQLLIQSARFFSEWLISRESPDIMNQWMSTFNLWIQWYFRQLTAPVLGSCFCFSCFLTCYSCCRLVFHGDSFAIWREGKLVC